MYAPVNVTLRNVHELSSPTRVHTIKRQVERVGCAWLKRDSSVINEVTASTKASRPALHAWCVLQLHDATPGQFSLGMSRRVYECLYVCMYVCMYVFMYVCMLLLYVCARHYMRMLIPSIHVSNNSFSHLIGFCFDERSAALLSRRMRRSHRTTPL